MVKVVLLCYYFNGFHEEGVGTGSLNIGCDLCCIEADVAECSLLLITGHVVWYFLCSKMLVGMWQPIWPMYTLLVAKTFFIASFQVHRIIRTYFISTVH
jgi:hypothetical protein